MIELTIKNKRVTTTYEFELAGWVEVEVILDSGQTIRDKADRLRVSIEEMGTLVDAWSPVRRQWSPLTSGCEHNVLLALGVPV